MSPSNVGQFVQMYYSAKLGNRKIDSGNYRCVAILDCFLHIAPWRLFACQQTDDTISSSLSPYQ